MPSDSVRAVRNQDGAVHLDIRQGFFLKHESSRRQKTWDLLKLNEFQFAWAEALRIRRRASGVCPGLSKNVLL